MTRFRFVLVVLLVAGATAVGDAAAGTPPTAHPHVFVVVLENKTYESTFAADSPAPYLAKELPRQGVLLRGYHGVAHVSLGNYLAMVSGQAPNPETQSDCQWFTDFRSRDGGQLDDDGQAVGTGCVMPPDVLTVADQLEAARLPWRGYFEDMASPCRHPEVGARDDTQSAEVGDQYATRHNPFVYFHSIIDDRASCERHVVDLRELDRDLARPEATPALSFIVPNLCHDGHDEPCVDGEVGGLAGADAFLRTLVPRITRSPAFRANGVLVITFDEAEAVGEATDARACCHQPTGPNTPLPGITGRGGGRTGAVVLSPFVRAGTMSDEPYNHYALLRTIEDLFGLSHLGFAGQAGLRALGSDVFSRR